MENLKSTQQSPKLIQNAFKDRSGFKTYSHLQSLNRLPTEYEITTTNLHYYTDSGFEVNAPLNEWYQRNQVQSRFQCSDWEKFLDPRATTYSTYVVMQNKKESFVDTLMEHMGNSAYDKDLSDAWIKTLEEILTPLRYVFHSFQMMSAYIGQMAPSGKITAVCAFQSADEMRKVFRIAYRMAQLNMTRKGFGQHSQNEWENNPIWQPIRKAIEYALATYDWGEAFVALNVVLKPALEELFLVDFGNLAVRRGDYMLKEMLRSFHEDSVWHRQWTKILLDTVISDTAASREAVLEWIDRWSPFALSGVHAMMPLFEELEVDVMQHCKHFIDQSRVRIIES